MSQSVAVNQLYILQDNASQYLSVKLEAALGSHVLVTTPDRGQATEFYLAHYAADPRYRIHPGSRLTLHCSINGVVHHASFVPDSAKTRLTDFLFAKFTDRAVYFRPSSHTRDQMTVTLKCFPIRVMTPEEAHKNFEHVLSTEDEVVLLARHPLLGLQGLNMVLSGRSWSDSQDAASVFRFSRK